MKTLLVALLFLFVGTGTAFAECAWVLWVKGKGWAGWYENWTPISAFAGLKECDGIRGAGYETQYDDRCLPDTVDPRGPKGK